MAFWSPVSSTSAAPATAATPRPQAGATPVPAPRPAVSALRNDRVDRPAAAPSPAPSASPLGRLDAVPILIAGGIIVGGAAIAAPALLEGTLALGEGAGALGSAALRSRAFITIAAREMGAEYRAAAQSVKATSLSDPHALGKALGGQGWKATEEFGRSSVMAAGLAGGAWAIERASALVHRLLADNRSNEAKR